MATFPELADLIEEVGGYDGYAHMLRHPTEERRTVFGEPIHDWEVLTNLLGWVQDGYTHSHPRSARRGELKRLSRAIVKVRKELLATAPRYRYGLTTCDVYAIPAGHVANDERDHRFKYGTVDYLQPLTPAQLKRFGIAHLGGWEWSGELP